MARDIISFSSKLAEKVGFENAGFLQDIAFWIDHNRTSNVNFFDGRYWSFSTQESLCERHPYWTRKQIQRIIKNCRDNGWLLIGNFNKNPYDRTNWYSVSDEIMKIFLREEEGKVECPERGIQNPQSGQCNNEYKNDKKMIISPLTPPKGETGKSDVHVPSKEETGFSDGLQEKFEEWVLYKKKEKRKPYKEIGLKNLVSEIREYAKRYGDSVVIKVIRTSMSAGYQGIIWDRLEEEKSKERARNEPF